MINLSIAYTERKAGEDLWRQTVRAEADKKRSARERSAHIQSQLEIARRKRRSWLARLFNR